MKYISVCSGIEAATVAWHPLGFKPLAFSEIEKFPRAVLQHHYPEVPLHGDFTTIGDEYGRPDILVGGTPCQSFSIAGLRKGMDDERGNLALEYLKLTKRLGAKWLVWENVPGVLSSNGGKDFGSFLGGLVQLGYGFAYRVLDAQYFGVAQRRRRVFVVGYIGDWRPPAAVLFESASLSWDSPPSREKRQSVAALTANGVGTCGADDNQGQANHLMVFNSKASSSTLDNCKGDGLAVAYKTTGAGFWQEGLGTLRAREQDSHENLICMSHGQPGAEIRENGSPTLTCNHEAPIIISGRARGDDGRGYDRPEHISTDIAGSVDTVKPEAVCYENHMQDSRVKECGDLSPQINAKSGTGGGNLPLIQTEMQVRRLTPVECERLQGFPDNYTQIPWRNKSAVNCPDGPRYKALGNSMAVPVMSWIGERIKKVEELI